MWKKFSKLAWQWRGVLASAPSVAAVVAAIRLLGLLQDVELAAFDLLLRLRPLESPDDRVVIVDITEDNLQEVGTWPIPDEILADLLEAIAAREPRAIGLDIYRDLPVQPGYEDLVAAYRNIPSLIGIRKVAGQAVAPPPVLAELDRVASNDIPNDPDSKVRRGLLYLNDPDGELVFGLAFRLAWLYLAEEGIQPEELDDRAVGLGQARFQDLSPNYGAYVRLNEGGYQVPVLYRGPQGTVERFSLMETLSGEIPEDAFRDRVVLIGSTAESLKDFISTPYTDTLLGSPKFMAGVEYHAQLTSHLISAALDGRQWIRSWPDWLEYIWILAAAFMGAIASWRWRYAPTLLRLLLLAAVVGGLLGIGYAAFLVGWWIPVVPPILAAVGAAALITTYVARSASDIRQTFSRYLTDEVVANLLETPGGLQMGGERREITILTSDLRGFTAISERLSPERVVSILNIYLEAMADVITAYQGTIDEFMGDGILVLFGAPTAREDDVERAIACAIAMQLAMKGVNQSMRDMGLSELEMGIGINTGEVVVGNIGSHKRTKYGVVGSQVNLTYRVESYTVGGQILISESTYNYARDLVRVDGEQKVSPKGVRQPISIYSVCGMGGRYNLSLSKAEEELWTLPEAIAVEFSILEGKDVGMSLSSGKLVKLSTHLAELSASAEINPPQ